MDIGKITPAFHDGEEIREWRVPVSVYDEKTGKEFKVVSIYEDEGVFCIDIEVDSGNVGVE